MRVSHPPLTHAGLSPTPHPCVTSSSPARRWLMGACMALLVLDLTSHWYQMYSSFLVRKASHKDVAATDFWLMRWYYSSRPFMAYCCIGAEASRLSLYVQLLYLVLYLDSDPLNQQVQVCRMAFRHVTLSCCTLIAFPHRISSVPPISTSFALCLPLVFRVNSERTLIAFPHRISSVSLPYLGPTGVIRALGLLCLPGWALKQITNVVQLKTAADACVEYDLEKTRKASRQLGGREEQIACGLVLTAVFFSLGVAAAAPGESKGLYLVHMTSAPPVVAYRGGIAGLTATAVAEEDEPSPGRTHRGSAGVMAGQARAGRGPRQLRPRADDPHVRAYAQHLTSLHERTLTSVGLASTSMVYSYNFAANSFCAELTPTEAQQLRARPDVGRVARGRKVRALTTYSPRFLKLGAPKGAWEANGGKMNAGEGVVVGILDTGIWPEHPSFANQGYGPPPKHWKGACTGLKKCNGKIVGARYFLSAYEREYGKIARGEYRSARDAGGHGTWCAGAAVGNSGVVLTERDGTPIGTASGMAPRGRLAVYKALWYNGSEGYGHDCDIFAAVDQAVADGVDVLSMSIGSGEDTYFGDLPLLRAAEAGVFVTLAAGNAGPPGMGGAYRTISNTSPFYLTVAASTTDHDAAMLYELRAAGSSGDNSSYAPQGDSAAAKRGLLSHATRPRTLQAVYEAPVIAPFSSAGPPLNPSRPPPAMLQVTNDILKPDVTGPGMDLVAAAAGGTTKDAWYTMKSGTSMSTPQLAGIAALLIQKYPNWRPAAIKSAIMTTAYKMNNRGGIMRTFMGTRATPWNFGSGHVNTSAMLDPGLVYDVGRNGYFNFLAGVNKAAANKAFPAKRLSPIKPWSLNQPNICVSRLKNVVTVTRTVTSVTAKAQTYQAQVRMPANVDVQVTPKQFTILPKQTVTFQVKLTPKKNTNQFSFGELV
ncbi:unnamed protein product, partial [Closterium sp. Yama58-4]